MSEDRVVDFGSIVRLIARLRTKEGCPWDRQQTRDSMKPYILEETYELLDAVDRGDWVAIKKELGDLLFNIAFYTRLAEEDDEFCAHDVLSEIHDRMIARHRHVFEATETSELKELLTEWESAKREEVGKDRDVVLGSSEADSLLDRTCLYPALLQALEIQSRAEVLGWTSSTELEESKQKCIQILESLPEPSANPLVAVKLGETLFSLVNVCRQHSVVPEAALRAATKRFVQGISS